MDPWIGQVDMQSWVASVVRRRMGVRSLLSCTAAFVVAMVILISVTIINLKKLEGIRVKTDDIYLDLSKPDMEMRVLFDMHNPSQIHTLRVQEMSCDVLMYSSDDQERKQLLGKLVSDQSMNSKPGSKKVLHATSLVEVGFFFHRLFVPSVAEPVFQCPRKKNP